MKAKIAPTRSPSPSTPPPSTQNQPKSAKNAPKPTPKRPKRLKKSKKSLTPSSPPAKPVPAPSPQVSKLKNLTKMQARRQRTPLSQNGAYDLHPTPERLKRMGVEELTARWYRELEKKGFKDVEKHDSVAKSASGEKTYHVCTLLNWQKRNWDTRLESTRELYLRLTNYLTHVQRPFRDDAGVRVAGRAYAAGKTYGEIAELLHRRGYIKKANKWYSHKLVQRFIKAALKWNTEDPEGLDYRGVSEGE